MSAARASAKYPEMSITSCDSAAALFFTEAAVACFTTCTESKMTRVAEKGIGKGRTTWLLQRPVLLKGVPSKPVLIVDLPHI